MSEGKVKVQSSPVVSQGAQKPLTTDSSTADRRGNEFPQNQLSYCRGVNVEAGSNPISGGAKNDLNRGATVQGRAQENAKHVDQRCIEGSYAGDTRKSGDTAAESVARAANGEGGPRGAVAQFPNGKRDMTLGSFSKDHSHTSFPGNLADSDQGN